MYITYFAISELGAINIVYKGLVSKITHPPQRKIYRKYRNIENGGINLNVEHVSITYRQGSNGNQQGVE